MASAVDIQSYSTLVSAASSRVDGDNSGATFGSLASLRWDQQPGRAGQWAPGLPGTCPSSNGGVAPGLAPAHSTPPLRLVGWLGPSGPGWQRGTGGPPTVRFVQPHAGLPESNKKAPHPKP
ncbi:uncharacterized protein JN550_010875 [Neoarthrinium moseri]|uniref:uncharacterized protein n=1 Tax=Neoarthrinium moseri TaxID=1658444 RepID=UPI001FDD7E5F|nr:uncharacterized protein JN550_010875 [Neoarthrinium moseri]KAI1861345.1 hypothetical protein JN550_010875 [Neoarthrinium moseri]